MRFEGKCVVVTGASSGMGRRIALDFAKEGATVVAVARRKERLDEIAAEAEAFAGKILPYQGDVSKEEVCNGMIDFAVEVCGKLDILVNNAGVVDDAYLLMLNNDSLDRSLDINVKGYFYCSQQAALKMFKQKSGRIVNVSSVSSKLALAGQSVYGATKGAVNSMTATLAKELAPYGIQVNAVAPGFITTEMIEAIPEEKKEEYLKNIPMGRLGKVEEVAEVVNMLCSDVASYITGQVIVIDGGLSL